ncbi:alpha/beta fold hydrolase [Pseudomonas denitrificans (nom. rej.)]|uniref:Alpha/beta hydrolase n=1 Tax=Pseudomonas denitrificans TaxID=43306 RepID=A0A9X7MZY7_PSEDE|nr:alpha/beta hydrolase [Pseudomonas denitrificans (nom. rej.)]QEY72511.1 alpha/beta hydrolase [Pseudomonas denitrificans (nom. rej.)]
MKKALLALLLAIAVTAGVLYAFPSTLLATAQYVESARARLSTNSLQVDDLDITYYEGGPDKAQTILLIHGFGADKSNWPRFARFLTKDYHVIAVDLPGFGDSSKPANISYDVGTQAERLADFMREQGIGRFHVVGNSMGGHIAALLAARHPQEVLSVGLFDNAGVIAPHPSELFERLKNGENPLVLRSVDDFPTLLDFVFVQKPPLPSRLQDYLAERSLERSAFNGMVFQQLRERYIPLEPELPKITAPTLLLWGDRDRVLDVSSIDVMKPLLKKPSVAILRDCGHVPMIERPEETARLYLDFLRRNHTPVTASN